jgi:hypothetical protein
LFKFLCYVEHDLQYDVINVRNILPASFNFTGSPHKPVIWDPYEKNRDLGKYLSDKNWALLKFLAADWKEKLWKNSHLAFRTACLKYFSS